jgi:hypothetical protein
LFFVHLLSQSLLQEFLERQTLLGCDRTDFGAVSMTKCGATWKFRASFLLESAWVLTGLLPTMLGFQCFQEVTRRRRISREYVSARPEGGFVNFAIRIFRQHRAAKGSRAGAPVKWWINASNGPSETPNA